MLSWRAAWVPLEKISEQTRLGVDELYAVLSMLEDMEVLKAGNSNKQKFYKIKDWRATFQGYILLELTRNIPLKKKHYRVDGLDSEQVLARMVQALRGAKMVHGLTGVFPHDYARDPSRAHVPHHFHVDSTWESERFMQSLKLRECALEQANVVLLLDQCPLGLESVIRRVGGFNLCCSLQVYLDFMIARVGDRVDPEQLWRKYFPHSAAPT